MSTRHALALGAPIGGALCLAVGMMAGCSSFLGEIPGRTKLADCSTGPAYRYEAEVLCDDFKQTTFAAYRWTTNDAGSVCSECARRR